MSTKNEMIWTGVVVAASLLILVGILYFGHAPAPTPVTQPLASPTSTLPIETAQPAMAPTGTLATGFPKELILDPKAGLSQSYSIGYASSTNQYTATFSSAMSMNQLFNTYQTYLKDNQWKIANTMTQNSNSRGIYAKNTTADVSVAILDQGSTREVTVSYLLR